MARLAQRETFRRRLDIDETSSSSAASSSSTSSSSVSSASSVFDEDDNESVVSLDGDGLDDASDWTADDDENDIDPVLEQEDFYMSSGDRGEHHGRKSQKAPAGADKRIRKLILANGSVYKGTVCGEDRKPHGKGEMCFPDGSKYVGEWSRGKMHGQGTYVMADGSIYEGEFAGNKCGKEGKLISSSNGVVYNGGLKDGKPDGVGDLTNSDGLVYKGGWLGGKADGSGELYQPQWGRYKGQWRRGLRNGLGTFESARGTKFEGNMVNDKIEGLASVILADGATFSGYYVNGEMQGTGTYNSTANSKTGKKTVFSGVWRGNTKDGLIFRSGRLAFSDGAAYEGDWINDRPHGRGLFINPYGVMFRGVWTHGLFQALESGYDAKGICTFQMEGEEYIKAMEQCSLQTTIQPGVEPGDPQGPARLPSMAVGSRLLSEEPISYVGDPLESVVYPLEDHEDETKCPIDGGYIYITQFVTDYWPTSGKDSLTEITGQEDTSALHEKTAPPLINTAGTTPVMIPHQDEPEGDETCMVRPSVVVVRPAVTRIPPGTRSASSPMALVSTTAVSGMTMEEAPPLRLVSASARVCPTTAGATRATTTTTTTNFEYSPPTTSPIESNSCVVEEATLFRAQPLVPPPRIYTSSSTIAYRPDQPRPWITTESSSQTVVTTSGDGRVPAVPGAGVPGRMTLPISSRRRVTEDRFGMASTITTPMAVGHRRSAEQLERRDILRRIPRPVESVTTIELALPKISTVRKKVNMPIYTPRLVEVPVALDSLTVEGLELYEEILELIERSIADGRKMGVRLSATEYDETVSRICYMLNRTKEVEGTLERPIKAKDLSCFMGIVGSSSPKPSEVANGGGG